KKQAERESLKGASCDNSAVPLKGAASPESRTEKWGPALLPAPTAPSEGSAGVRNLAHFDLSAQSDPLSILAHQLRRRFPSNRSLRRGARPLLDCASRRFACLSLSSLSVRASIPEPKFQHQSSRPKPSDVPRPFLG